MEEQIISFETAKLAKEKGFNEDSLWYYYTLKIHDRHIGYLSSNTGSSNDQIFIRDNKTVYAPTQSLLQKWLREKYNIDITIRICMNYTYQYIIHINRNIPKNFKDNFTHVTPENHKHLYEATLELALQEVFKLI